MKKRTYFDKNIARHFIVVAPYPPDNLGEFLILSPPLFGIFGFITAILGHEKNKTNLGIVLIIANVIFLCWLVALYY